MSSSTDQQPIPRNDGKAINAVFFIVGLSLLAFGVIVALLYPGHPLAPIALFLGFVFMVLGFFKYGLKSEKASADDQQDTVPANHYYIQYAQDGREINVLSGGRLYPKKDFGKSVVRLWDGSQIIVQSPAGERFATSDDKIIRCEVRIRCEFDPTDLDPAQLRRLSFDKLHDLPHYLGSYIHEQLTEFFYNRDKDTVLKTGRSDIRDMIRGIIDEHLASSGVYLIRAFHGIEVRLNYTTEHIDVLQKAMGSNSREDYWRGGGQSFSTGWTGSTGTAGTTGGNAGTFGGAPLGSTELHWYDARKAADFRDTPFEELVTFCRVDGVGLMELSQAGIDFRGATEADLRYYAVRFEDVPENTRREMGIYPN